MSKVNEYFNGEEYENNNQELETNSRILEYSKKFFDAAIRMEIVAKNAMVLSKILNDIKTM